MKKILFGLSLLGMLGTTSCTSKDDSTADVPAASNDINGTIKSNKTFAKGNYTLSGIVKIDAGVTVTFDAGSIITCDQSKILSNALVVLNGGRLVINGTADQPVVFTEKSKVPGTWGGIIMYGDAPITGAANPSTPGATTISTSEDGNNISYGGTNPLHDGGSLNYVRVEYAGSKLLDGQKENNSFTFYSVGSKTVLNNLVAYKGADDGFEFFGGTVSMKNAISYGNFDDAFDWQDGWQGTENTNWYAYQVVKGNYGMEIESSLINNPFGPKVTGITLKRAAGCAPEVGDNQVDAFQFKREGNGTYDNIVIDGYLGFTTTATPPVNFPSTVVRIEDVTTNTNQVAASKIKVTNVKVTNTNILVPIARGSSFTVNFPDATFTINDKATGADLTPGAWATTEGINLLANLK